MQPPRAPNTDPPTARRACPAVLPAWDCPIGTATRLQGGAWARPRAVEGVRCSRSRTTRPPALHRCPPLQPSRIGGDFCALYAILAARSAGAPPPLLRNTISLLSVCLCACPSALCSGLALHRDRRSCEEQVRNRASPTRHAADDCSIMPFPKMPPAISPSSVFGRRKAREPYTNAAPRRYSHTQP